MANLIDYTYFKTDISLPLDEIRGQLTAYIDRFEPEILQKVLGYTLYSQFLAGIAIQNPLQKWLDLRDGKVYTVDGYSVKWPGLVNTEKESFIAYYVYYQYAKLASTFNSGSGLKLAQSENSTVSDYRHKQARALNRACDIIGGFGENAYTGTLYNFLMEHETDYPDCQFTRLEKTTMFNI